MSGRKSRDKGLRTERAVVKLLQEHGLAAERVPLSGMAGGKFSGDISVPVLGKDRTGEVKCRSNGFKEIYTWIDGQDFLVIKADNKPALVVFRLAECAKLVAEADLRRCGAAVAEILHGAG